MDGLTLSPSPLSLSIIFFSIFLTLYLLKKFSEIKTQKKHGSKDIIPILGVMGVIIIYLSNDTIRSGFEVMIYDLLN